VSGARTNQAWRLCEDFESNFHDYKTVKLRSLRQASVGTDRSPLLMAGRAHRALRPLVVVVGTLSLVSSYGCGGNSPTVPLACSLNNPFTVAGRVLEAASNGPIAGASVQILGNQGNTNPQSATTDSSGHYSIVGVCGTTTVRAEVSGYESQTQNVTTNGQSLSSIPPNSTFTLDFQLTRARPEGIVVVRAPVGLISESQPSFVFIPVPNATRYLLVIESLSGGAGPVSHPTGTTFGDWFDDSQLFCRTDMSGIFDCRVAPVQLRDGSYRWRITAWNPGGFGPQREWVHFVLVD
jgi:hypothetical protein